MVLFYSVPSPPRYLLTCTLSLKMTTATEIALTREELSTLHWDGIVAVCTGQFKNLSDAKAHLKNKMLLEKSGMKDEILTVFLNDKSLTDFYVATIVNGEQWGDLWYDSTYNEMLAVKKELSQIFVQLALEPAGRWRLGAKRIQLEERYQQLQKDLGYSSD